MPIQVGQVFPPDATYAGGIEYGGKLFQVGWNFLSGNRAKKLEDIRAAIQDELDVRIKLTDLPDGDPDKTTDPAPTHTGPLGAWLFWEGTGGNTELVCRLTLVTVVDTGQNYGGDANKPIFALQFTGIKPE